jgi:hypothetical protein
MRKNQNTKSINTSIYNFIKSLLKGEILEKTQEYVEIRLPRPIVEKVRKMVECHNGLFEDETDYIHHCIISYNRST